MESHSKLTIMFIVAIMRTSKVNFYQAAWCHIPEENSLNSHYHDNLKSMVCSVCLSEDMSGTLLFLCRIWWEFRIHGHKHKKVIGEPWFPGLLLKT
jgi:hypothetical protein